MFELYGDAAKVFRTEYPEQAPRHPRPVLGRGRTVHSLPARHGPARGAVGPDCLSIAEIHRPQHDGADPGGGSLSRQSRRPVLARRHARLSQPDEIRARWSRRDCRCRRTGATTIGSSCRTIIAFMDDCVAKGAISLRGTGGVLEEAGSLSQEGHRVGGADAGRPLDVRDRRMEDDARRRLGQDLRGQQHHLCGAPEQHPVQRPGAVLRAGGRSTTG